MERQWKIERQLQIGKFEVAGKASAAQSLSFRAVFFCGKGRLEMI